MRMKNRNRKQQFSPGIRLRISQSFVWLCKIGIGISLNLYFLIFSFNFICCNLLKKINNNKEECNFNFVLFIQVNEKFKLFELFKNK